IRRQIESKFGSKGARVVEENMNVIKRGFDEVQEILNKVVGEETLNLKETYSEPALPAKLKMLPQSESPASDVHRFWEQTGNFYARGLGNDNITDPFIGLGIMPATTSLFRYMTGIRFEHPEWNAENCTACGNCYTVCPDTAIPGLVNEIGQVFDTVVNRIKKQGKTLNHLPKATRKLEPLFRKLLNECEFNDS